MRPKHIEDRAAALYHYELLIEKYIKYWIPILGLDSWTRIDITCKLDHHAENRGILGLTVSDWQYMEADIFFYPSCMIECDASPDRVEYVVLHELCHILICEMRVEDSVKDYEEFQRKHEERVVCNMANSLLRTKEIYKPEVTKAAKSKSRKKAQKK